jgi:hypothetical protein
MAKIAAMRNQISIAAKGFITDASGFKTPVERVIAVVKAFVEQRSGAQRWANYALFSDATALFRFRRIPDVAVTEDCIIVYAEDRYEIQSVHDVKGLYLEVLARKITPEGASHDT